MSWPNAGSRSFTLGEFSVRPAASPIKPVRVLALD
jgi:hypothetical protein